MPHDDEIRRFDEALRSGRLEPLALEIHGKGLAIRATWELFSDYMLYLRGVGRTDDAKKVHDRLDGLMGTLGSTINPRLLTGFEDALRGGTLVGFAQALHGAGLKKQEIHDRFTEFAYVLRGAGREDDEELVNALLDQLTGWTEPRLFPEEPDAE